MILVLGGTSDSLEICDRINKYEDLPYTLSVTTSYGEDLARKHAKNVITGKLTKEDMVRFIEKNNIPYQLNKVETNTGSKNLPKIVELIPDRNLIVRVLPTSDVILSCESLGLNADNIIAMKGPFSQSINEEFYKHYNVDIVVTKESGIAGGFLEKVNACETLQIPVVIITREKINYPLVVNEIDELEKLL